METKNIIILILLLLTVVFAILYFNTWFKSHYITINEATRECSLVVNQTQNNLIQQCQQVISQLQQQQSTKK